tara:strand:+ start:9459 stop:10232 length:774 start_codon:yes stop_codon:yes gene_type:complete
MIGFTCSQDGIKKYNAMGDWLVASSFPENIFKLTNEKVIDVYKSWVFDHNPYVVRNEEPERIIDIMPAWFKYSRSSPIIYSFSDSLVTMFSNYRGQPPLRHPRLYKYEDLDMIPNRIVLHIDGSHDKPTPRLMDEEVINFILDKYKNYDIIQVGGKNDRVIDGITNLLGMDYWETVKIISQCAMFIGVDSGPLHIAQAYPKINRKMIVTKAQFESDWPEHYWPMNPNDNYSFWYDWDINYFNEFDRDVGVTTSYKDI